MMSSYNHTSTGAYGESDAYSQVNMIHNCHGNQTVFSARPQILTTSCGCGDAHQRTTNENSPSQNISSEPDSPHTATSHFLTASPIPPHPNHVFQPLHDRQRRSLGRRPPRHCDDADVVRGKSYLCVLGGVATVINPISRDSIWKVENASYEFCGGVDLVIGDIAFARY
jgi:hypothetical protein